MRIVQIVESLKVGGLEKMAVDLAIAHRKAGHFSAIYTVFDPGPLAAQAAGAGVSVVPFHKAIGFRPGTILAMAKRLRADGAQVVHTHNSGIHHYGVLAGRLAGIKAIVNTRHGLAFHSGQRQELYYRTIMPLTSAVVFVCDNGRRHFTESGAVFAKLGVEDRHQIDLAADQHLKEWDETTEFRTRANIRPITPLRRLLSQHQQICERILDEEEIEAGLWAQKRGSRRHRQLAKQL